jgi:transcriptional regulator with XRE-family HTH domain
MALEERYLVAMEDARRRVPEVIRALMAARRAKGPDVARAIGLSSSSFYARLNGKSMIQAHELSALALYFGVPVSFFYEPPAGLLATSELTSEERAVSSVPQAA